MPTWSGVSQPATTQTMYAAIVAANQTVAARLHQAVMKAAIPSPMNPTPSMTKRIPVIPSWPGTSARWIAPLNHINVAASLVIEGVAS